MTDYCSCSFSRFPFFSPGDDAAADVPRPLDRRLKVVDLGTTPLGSTGITPTPPPGSTLGGCTGTTPTPPPGSTLRGSGGSTLRWSGGSTERPEGVGGHFGTTLASTSGFTASQIMRPRVFQSIFNFIFVSFRFRVFRKGEAASSPLVGSGTSVLNKRRDAASPLEGAVAEVPHFNRTPSTRRGEGFRCFSHTKTRF